MKLIKTVLPIAVAFGVGSSVTLAQDAVKLSGKYRAVQVAGVKFKTDLEMTGRERDEYARHLTTYALGQITVLNGSQKSLDDARKFIGVALHLSPRNREAVIANVQLSKGVMPKQKRKGFNKSTLSTLLHARAVLLKENKGELNQLLTQAFLNLSVELNPNNEQAIYDAEMFSQDYGKLDWSQFTGK